MYQWLRRDGRLCPYLKNLGSRHPILQVWPKCICPAVHSSLRPSIYNLPVTLKTKTNVRCHQPILEQFLSGPVLLGILETQPVSSDFSFLFCEIKQRRLRSVSGVVLTLSQFRCINYVNPLASKSRRHRQKTPPIPRQGSSRRRIHSPIAGLSIKASGLLATPTTHAQTPAGLFPDKLLTWGNFYWVSEEVWLPP